MPARTARAIALAAVLAAPTVGLAACVPEPLTTATASPTTEPATPATPAPTTSAEALALPGTCEELYSPAMLATLDADVPPLNDPGITMLSTQNVDAIEILDSAASALRCTWGPPSERGIATTVAVVVPEESETLAALLAAAGFSVEPYRDGTILRIRQESITLDDELVAMGETHYLGPGGWVATRWINVDPEGYTEDIVASVWG